MINTLTVLYFIFVSPSLQTGGQAKIPGALHGWMNKELLGKLKQKRSIQKVEAGTGDLGGI